MPERTIRVVRDGFPHQMALDTAVSWVLLGEASHHGTPETLRLTVPGRAVAFGKHDAVTRGFTKAVALAREAGFQPFLRMAGGRAAAFHEGTVAISWTIPDGRPIAGIRRRFEAAAGLIVDALDALGVDAAVGALPGEYCPGEFSVHIGASKVAGIGQRITRSAAHIGGVVVVENADLVRRALVPVYDALGLDWDPAIAGAVSDTAGDVEPRVVIDAIIDRLGRDAQLETASISNAVIEAAEAIAADFTAG